MPMQHAAQILKHTGRKNFSFLNISKHINPPPPKWKGYINDGMILYFIVISSEKKKFIFVFEILATPFFENPFRIFFE